MGLDSFNNDPALNAANRRLAAQGQPPVTPPTPASVVGGAVGRTNNAPRDARKLEASSEDLEEVVSTSRRRAVSIYHRYPLDLGSNNSEFPHIMKITIHRSIHSSFSEVASSANFDYRAGRQNNPTNFSTESLFAAGAIRAAQRAPALAATVLGGGYLFSQATGIGEEQVDRTVNNLVQGGQQALAGLKDATFDLARKTTKIEGSIDLYMPETMTMSDSHDFDTISVTDAMGLAALTQNLIGSDRESARLLGIEKGVAAASALGVFGERADQSVLQAQGYAINPLLQIIYQGSKNREFEYTFKFAPRSEKEAAEVMKIIRTLRFHAAPEYLPESKSSRYFIPPSEFEIEHWYYSPFGTERELIRNEKLPRIAQCVLSNIDINYAAGGNYATFEDGTPVEIDMRLRFTETVNLTKEDINNGY